MATAGSGRGFDPDDWFDEPETSDTWSGRVDRIARERRDEDVDDWVGDAAPATPPSETGFRPSRAVVAIAVLAVCVLLGILAAAGVFSGGGKPAAATTEPPATTGPATTAATTTQQRPQPVVPTGTLKPGASGPAVKLLQRALARAGYDPGTIDGKYGPGTTQAVTKFQQAHALTGDGIAGAQTLAALKTALATG